MTKKLNEPDHLINGGCIDPFSPDQKIGITRLEERLHGSPREVIMEATHDLDLKQYICTKSSWTSEILDTVDWEGFNTFMNSINSIRQTNVIKMTHDWIHDGHQKTLFSKEGEMHLCPAECGLMESHQHYVACFAPPMIYQKAKCIRNGQKIFKQTRTATPVSRALTYILKCVMHETEPFPRRFAQSPI